MPAGFKVLVEESFDVTTDANGRKDFRSDLPSPCWAVVVNIAADPGNSVSVLVGGGSPTKPLAPGQARVMDAPPGYVIDAAGLKCATSPATSGQVLHVTVWKVTVDTPQGTVPPGTVSANQGSGPS